MFVRPGEDPYVITVMKWYFVYFPGNFMVITLFFNVSRRFGFNALQNYVPSSMTTVMSWISFWIKKESAPARTSLGKWVRWGSTWAQNCLVRDPFSGVIYGYVAKPTSTPVL